MCAYEFLGFLEYSKTTENPWLGSSIIFKIVKALGDQNVWDLLIQTSKHTYTHNC